MHELCGWIERVASARSIRWPLGLISSHGLEMLKPLLISISGDDRREVFGDRLTKNAIDFLKWYHKKYYH